MVIRIVNKSGNELPEYSTLHASGMDVRAFLQEEVILKPLERKLIPTGLYVEIPEGYEGQVRPRSGLALNHSITVLNSPGTIDSDYRGEIKVILINHGKKNFKVKFRDRIAQLIIAKVERIDFVQSDRLRRSKRGSGGYGSTGK